MSQQPTEDDAQRLALDAILKADGWVLCAYTTNGAGHDEFEFVTCNTREVAYMLTRTLGIWEDSLDDDYEPDALDGDDEEDDDDRD